MWKIRQNVYYNEEHVIQATLPTIRLVQYKQAALIRVKDNESFLHIFIISTN